jgi:hypothetical protein
MPDLRLLPPTMADVARELARPVEDEFEQILGDALAKQLHEHVADLEAIRLAAGELRPLILGKPPGVHSLEMALIFLKAAALSMATRTPHRRAPR